MGLLEKPRTLLEGGSQDRNIFKNCKYEGGAKKKQPKQRDLNLSAGDQAELDFEEKALDFI